MTFTTTLPKSDIVSDAELARAAAAGDRTALAGITGRRPGEVHTTTNGGIRKLFTGFRPSENSCVGGSLNTRERSR